MRRPRGRLRRIGTATAVLLAVAALGGLPPFAGRAAAQDPMPSAGEEGEEAEVPHPFFTHMGLPEGVGKWNLRAAGLATRADGSTDGDFAFHLETGITKLIGLHIRNDRFLAVPRTEAMFQFAVLTSRNGMSGIAPIIEFEVPTRSGGGSRINTLVGFTSTLANSRAAFNQALHYDPREDAVDASAAFVFQVGKRVFPVIEILGEDGPGASAIVNLLGGVKVRLRDGIIVGIAYQAAVTSNKDFSWQLVGEPEVEWRWGR